MYKIFTNFFCGVLPCFKHTRFLKLKLTFILSLFVFLQVSATSKAQNVSLNVKNLPVDQLLDQISQQTGFHFLYTKKMLGKSIPVSVNIDALPLNEALAKCFISEPFSYVIKKKNVILVNKPTVSVAIPVADQAPKNIDITGTVTDEKNRPLPGVSVIVKGTSKGIVTDNDGKYVLHGVDKNATLSFSFIGYATKDIAVDGQNTINTSLNPKDGSLNEVVVVAYGTSTQKNLIGAVSTVKSGDLTAAPVANITNARAGRLPGLISQQSSGQPGCDAATISIRGYGAALIIIDGVEGSMSDLDPNQVESISILKDASAAIYGARAGNGVVLVTTKRGNNGKPIFNFNSTYTLQGITDMPKPVSAGQYTQLKDEAYLQSGQPAAGEPFTQDQINKYYAGTDPQYPNTNWYNVLVKKWSPETENNLSVKGGSENIRYYGFLGYTNQQSMWRTNGGSFQRYNLQSNIDAQINKNLSMQLDVSGNFSIRDNPWRPSTAGGNSVWQDFWNTLPIYPASLPDPSKVPFANGGGTGGAHVTTNSAISGYDDINSQDIKGTLALNYNAPFIKGLSAKVLINYIQDYGNEKDWSKPVKFYTYDYASKTYTQAGQLSSLAALSITNTGDQVITGQASLNYDNTFHNGDHHVQFLALYEGINTNTTISSAGRSNYLTAAIDQLFAGNSSYQTANGSATEAGRESYVGRLNYSYLGKYLLESTLRADASSVFPSAKQWGYFPSVSIGWLISEEKFIKNSASLIDQLKLRVSYEQSGLDNVGNYQYLTGYAFGGSYYIGGNPQPGLVSTGLANPNLTWERIKGYNAGVDYSLWQRKLYGSFDIFYRELTGIPGTLIATLPSTFGASLPQENINSQNNRGFEVVAGTTGKVGGLSFNISANISYSRAKWKHFDEPSYTDPDQRRISQLSGQYTDNVYGYKAVGLFTSQAQIDGLKYDEDGQKNATLRPGDIQYADVNGDGVLNYKDEVKIGDGTVPHWNGGLNMNFRYRGFDLATLFQGAFGYYTYVNLLSSGTLVYPEEVFTQRWTPQNNNANALVPRLGGSAVDNYYSNYYYKNAKYLRLKSLSIGYTLPKSPLEKAGFNSLRIFVAGTNLVTFDGLKKFGVDPEAVSGQPGFYYPQQRTLSVGINAAF